MHEKTIQLLRDEAQRLLQAEVELLEQMQRQPGVVADAHAGEQQTFTSASISKDLEVLRGEGRKLDDLEMVLAVVGTMKAGKSTTINAIVGTEVLPNRNRPMTALPTLIRHTPGQREPVLKFDNRGPINQLLLDLGRALKGSQALKQLEKLEADDDMQELLSLIRKQAMFRERYEGAELIFWFLKSLNDLVRLTAALNLEFPFSQYDEMHEMPVIEVEFAHLGQTSQTGGRLTLLDTPGPNESGQQHLRKMLNEQLKKASAVLAVLDFTQLKSDADEQVRAELAQIANIASGRLFALVNKFDQKDRNSDSADKIRSVVADDLMCGMLKHSDVFPVSSRWGYLANRAKHEVFLHGKLPDPLSQPWVTDFAVEAFGRRWESKIDNVEDVVHAAESLWEDSLFTDPLTNVIQTAHARAAAFAIDSAASKLLNTAESVVKFLGIRETALAKSAKVLMEQSTSLKADISKVERIRVRIEKDADDALAHIQERTQAAFNRIKDSTETAIDLYFKEGKRLEREQVLQQQEIEQAEHAKVSSALGALVGGALGGFFGGNKPGSTLNQGLNLPGTWRTKTDAARDFDPADPKIKFTDQRSAQDLIDRIDGAIKDKIKAAEADMLKVMGVEMQAFEQHFKERVTDNAQQIVDELNRRMSAEGFSIGLKVPDTRMLRIDLDAGDVLAGMVSQKSKQVTRYRRETGLWGKMCGFFNSSDWGWESYNTTEKFFQVDILQVKESVLAAITEVFKGLNTTIATSIEVPLNEAVETFFNAFVITIEQIRGDLLQGMRDQERSQAEQQALGQRLSELRHNVPGMLADSSLLKADILQLLPEGAKA